MGLMLHEIWGFFQRERIYFYLLIFIFCFYLVILFIQRTHPSERPSSQNLERMESLLRATPEKPEVIEARLVRRPTLKWLVHFFGLLFVSSFAVGLWFGASDLKRLFLKGEWIPSSNRKLSIGWGIAEVIRVTILFFVTAISLNLTLAFVRLVLFNQLRSPYFILVHTLLLDLTAILFIVFVVFEKGSRLKDILGFYFRKIPFHEIWWGIRTYFVILPLFVGILAFLIYISNRMAYEPPPHPLVEILLQDKALSSWALIFSVAVACIIGPIVEEIFFRGFFYPAVRKYLGAGWTILITAGFFSGVHENIFSFLPIFFLGVVLCYLYEKRSNLLACITLHVVHNTAFLTYFFLMKSILLDPQGGA